MIFLGVLGTAVVIAVLVIVAIDLADDESDEASLEFETICSDCDDGNVCTVDLCNGETKNKGCSYRNVIDGKACSTTCYTDAAPTCVSGVCTGTKCAGVCNTTSQCPYIKTTTAGLIAPTNCDLNLCLYQHTIGPDAKLYCGGDGDETNSIQKQICNGFLDVTGNYTSCLQVDDWCSYNGTHATVYCQFKFVCAPAIVSWT